MLVYHNEQVRILGVQYAPIPYRTRLLELYQGSTREKLNPTHLDFSKWKQEASHVMLSLTIWIQDHMLVYVKDAETPKQAWENLEKLFVENTTTKNFSSNKS